ncbi:fungal-specific transcription factor domain-containing protein [Dactylonectria macrodidyma]|uniref:Fungal-specific transcription factor domain-containing protein n=1 Tax=Dactylonectria macrodidyma TaxID=307937 RepID=A0A9P9J3T5_9HYPO|nr:fungal-specific transcription factor domain-containing protein [Dactylonectria macrodidyma]
MPSPNPNTRVNASANADRNPDQDAGTVSSGSGIGFGEPSSGQKRPAWDSNNNGNNDRASKRRASKACLSCRNRKVRCDVLSGGHPCTNCRLDKLDCIVKESNRGRKPGVTSSQAAPESPASNEVIMSNPTPPLAAAEPAERPAIVDTPPLSPQRRNHSSDYLISLSFEDQQSLPPDQEIADEIHVNVCSPTILEAGEIRGFAEGATTASDLGSTRQNISCAQPEHQHQDQNLHQEQRQNQHQRPPQDHCHHQHRPQPLPIGSLKLPPYIKPLARHLDARDQNYLFEKDALTIPDDSFRDELLRIYVYIVYPFMPALDLEDLLHPIMLADGRNPLSLLLFQAVMFASVTFVDAEILQARGYKSRKAARKVFFNRVRLLYSLDSEPERLPLLQAVLLMTYWYDSPADDKDTWYWMGIALSLAQVLGYNREPDPTRTSVKNRQLRRRIWWSCVMRDRLLALGIRRPSRIRDEEFGVSPLTLDDFDLHSPSEPIANLLGESRLTASGPSARSEMAVMCVELSRLCICLGHILHSQYSLVGSQPGGSEFLLKAIVVPKQTDSQLQDLARCDAELSEWLSSQDHRSKYMPTPRESEENQDEATQIIRLHQALLQMIYLTSMSVLHKPQVFYSGCDGDAASRKKASREKVSEAAVAITKVAFHLQTSNQLRYLSTSSIPAFLSASLIHLMDVRSPEEEIRNISIGRFYQCVHALQELQDMYRAADYAVKFIEAVLKNTDINVPMLRPSSTSPQTNARKAHGRRFSKWTSQCISFGRDVTAYPSPSSSRNQRLNQDDSEPPSRDTSNPFGGPDNVMPPAPSPLNAELETWSAATANGQFGGAHHDSGDVVPDSAFMGDWIDIDTFVPALINFEADSTMSLMNTNVPFL